MTTAILGDRLKLSGTVRSQRHVTVLEMFAYIPRMNNGGFTRHNS
ncbi:MAG: hypothetical protein V7K47_19120 [Nostoc sp.]